MMKEPSPVVIEGEPKWEKIDFLDTSSVPQALIDAMQNIEDLQTYVHEKKETSPGSGVYEYRVKGSMRDAEGKSHTFMFHCKPKVEQIFEVTTEELN